MIDPTLIFFSLFFSIIFFVILPFGFGFNWTLKEIKQFGYSIFDVNRILIRGQKN